MIFRFIIEDIQEIKKKDPAARNTLEVLLLYSGLHAVIYYRFAHWFYEKKLFFIARLISQTARFLTGIEIHPGATIGRRLFIDHGSGIIIGETTVIGDDCTLFQGVTLGGTGKDKGKRHPTLGNGVLVGAGAKVLGPFTIGNDVKIAAGAVVLNEIPEGSTAVGVPARVVKRRVSLENDEMDHIHYPDPVAQQLCQLQVKIAKLEQTIEKLTEKLEEKHHETV